MNKNVSNNNNNEQNNDNQNSTTVNKIQVETVEEDAEISIGQVTTEPETNGNGYNCFSKQLDGTKTGLTRCKLE